MDHKDTDEEYLNRDYALLGVLTQKENKSIYWRARNNAAKRRQEWYAQALRRRRLKEAKAKARAEKGTCGKMKSRL